MDMANTGRVTPRLLPVPRLKQILLKNVALRQSLIYSEPSLVYKFATAYPVKIDFGSLAFGYILKIPNPGRNDIYPLYRIDHVGFHQHDQSGSNYYDDKLLKDAVYTAFPQRLFHNTLC